VVGHLQFCERRPGGVTWSAWRCPPSSCFLLLVPFRSSVFLYFSVEFPLLRGSLLAPFGAVGVGSLCGGACGVSLCVEGERVAPENFGSQKRCPNRNKFPCEMKGNRLAWLGTAVRSDPARCGFVRFTTTGARCACGDDAFGVGPVSVFFRGVQIPITQRKKNKPKGTFLVRSYSTEAVLPPEKKALYDEIIRVDQVLIIQKNKKIHYRFANFLCQSSLCTLCSLPIVGAKAGERGAQRIYAGTTCGKIFRFD